MQTYAIHGTPVTPREIKIPFMGAYYTKNVLDYEGQQYDVLWNGVGDGHIEKDGHKLYLEN